MIAFEQHGAEHRLRFALAFLRRETEPSRRLTRVARRAGAVEIKPGQIILRIRIAEIRRRVVEHLARALSDRS